MLKKYLSNKTINLLEYYSTLNINNIFSNDITKSKHGSFANKEMLVSQLFKEINDQLNTKNNNNFFYKGNPDSQIMILIFRMMMMLKIKKSYLDPGVNF